jgi:hypothetical protein
MTVATRPIAIGMRGFAVRSRFGFSFAADGRHAACLSGTGGSPLGVEWWSMAGAAAGRRLLHPRDRLTIGTQVCCLRGGRVLLAFPTPGGHRLVLVEPFAGGPVERELTTIEYPRLRLIDTLDPDTLALAIGTLDGTRSTIWRILPTAPWLE